tara:strand:- start:2095 stop:2535 length:441 start_codon:yes stop_codon:yes gene_type:complete
MKIIELVQKNMYLSMKEKGKRKTIVLRTLSSKLKENKINDDSFNDQNVIKIIQTLVKQRQESSKIYRRAGREELADIETQEKIVLKEYLPNIMDDNQIKIVVKKLIKELNVKSISDIGRIMPLIIKEKRNTIDGKIANKILRDLLI